jgi:hypothetical protein
MLPADAEKPRPRREKKPPEDPLSLDWLDVIAATAAPMPAHGPIRFLTASGKSGCGLYTRRVPYFRGDFPCHILPGKTKATMPRVCAFGP